MAKPFVLLLVLLGGCNPYRVPPTPNFSNTPAHDVFARANRSNWRLRVQLDTAIAEGRVMFVERANARVGGRRVEFERVQRIERNLQTDVGGRRAGGIVGAILGFGLTYIGHGFVEYEGETNCAAGCTLGIMVPSLLFTVTVGSIIGAIVDPPTRAWTPIWRK